MTIEGLVIEKFANEAQRGRDRRALDWVIENNEVRLNHGDRGRQRRHRPRQQHPPQRPDGHGRDLAEHAAVLVENNEIAYNNYADFDAS